MEFFVAMHILCFIIWTIFIELYSCKVKVNTKQGVIIGIKKYSLFKQKKYFAFYGVPYANAPVGPLRFRNPKPFKGSGKLFDGSLEYHGACTQSHIVHKQSLYGQEDCLQLNIYTPTLPEQEDKNLFPVIVWIHGYAFTSSFSHIYGPDFIIENDILFISLTHRIGVFGFLNLNHSGSNVNVGLMDIIIGLKWIQKNIEFFGGDKNNITIMCSGSGGTFVSLLFLTKHRKLFHKLIIHSGSMFSPSLFQGLNYLDRHVLQKQIKSGGYKDYLQAPAEFLINLSNKIYSSRDTINLQRPIVPFSPLIEKMSKRSLVTLYDLDKYENNKNENFNIPILTGFTTQESLSEVIPFIHNPSYLKLLGKSFKYMVPFSKGCSYNITTHTYTTIANAIIQRYFNNFPDISIEEFLKYTTDIHTYPIYKFIQTHIMHSNRNLFVYKFNYSGKFNVMKATALAGINTRLKGAAHGDELCYILKCEPLWEDYMKLKGDFQNRDRIFMNNIVTMWTNFAKFGNPTPSYYDGNLTWLPMTSTEDNLLLFRNTSNLMIDSKKEARMFKFWNKLYDDYYSPKYCNKAHDEL